MSISKKLRFEVFKRDGFQCQYCGKSSPKVVLEADHVIPRKEGGQDNLENLITSCFDCNRGKGKELLEDYKEGTDPTEQAILLLERERQLKEYNEVLRKIRKRKKQDIGNIENHWLSTIGDRPQFPFGLIYKALDFIPQEKILEAIDLCLSNYTKWEDRSWNESIKAYFFGIIRNMTNNFGKE